MGAFRAVAAEDGPGASADEFVTYIDKLYAKAKEYGGRRSPDRLVMEFLRHEDYNDFQWDLLIGDVDQRFVKFVEKSGLKMVRYFSDPCDKIPIKASHFGASCNGVLVKGKPSGTATNEGDVAGWGGDLITFYADWRRDHRSWPSGYDYCQERLAKADKKSSFMLDDMIEDADAFNVALKIRGGSSIVNQVESLLQGEGCKSRFADFLRDRFGSEARAEKIAKNMLLPKDPVIILGRDSLINDIAGKSAARPEALPKKALDEFCRGFAATLAGLAASR